jgi:hypothetical protein
MSTFVNRRSELVQRVIGAGLGGTERAAAFQHPHDLAQSARLLGMSAEVKAETRGFSRRT